MRSHVVEVSVPFWSLVALNGVDALNEYVDHELDVVLENITYTPLRVEGGNVVVMVIGFVETVGKCIWCRQELHEELDGILVDETGGDACGVTTDTGKEHTHCRGFAPDSWGDDPSICTECLCHEEDHPKD